VRAASTFVSDRHDAETYDERDGVALGRIHITRTIRGDLEGTATAELLTAMTPTGSAVYVAFDRVEGTLHGRRGSFVLHHRGIAAADVTFANDGFVVADSATGELAGLRGTAAITVAADGTHQLTLDDELDAS
jgi:DMSO/TMAO reductase YedYZ molybdopterin-dependent catalytic subunit